jgi:HEPN domain-containing protein
LPGRDSRDHALLLLSKAQADKLVLIKLADDAEVTDDMIGFHAQQAVEKLIKAVLANRDIEYPRTHDIDRLVDLLEAHNVPLPPQARRLDELTPWATQLRYEELLDLEELDRAHTIQLVEAVVGWAEATIEPSPASPHAG